MPIINTVLRTLSRLNPFRRPRAWSLRRKDTRTLTVPVGNRVLEAEVSVSNLSIEGNVVRIIKELVMNGLLRSRKFWLAVFAVAQIILFQFVDVPDELWQAIAAIVAVLIGAIAVEDAGAKISF